MQQKIKFKNRDYILFDGIIATEKQIRDGKISYAFLRENKIYRYGEIIGHKNDIKFLEVLEKEIPVGGNFFKDWFPFNESMLLQYPLKMLQHNSHTGNIIKFRRYKSLTT
jgi:hypothetical protein